MSDGYDSPAHASGIFLEDCLNCVIKHLKLSSFAYTGIIIDGGTNITIKNNNLNKTSFYGIVLRGASNVLISENKIKYIKEYGVYLIPRVQNEPKTANKNIDINNNLFDWIDLYGIFIDASDFVKISRNLIQNVLYSGIILTSAFSNSEFDLKNVHVEFNEIIDTPR